MKNKPAEVDTSYRCVMVHSTPTKILKSEIYSIKGRSIKLPTRSLFVTEDGSVYVVVKKNKTTVDYASLDSLIEALKSTAAIESVSL